MGYCYFNPNPASARVGDCTVRAISRATGQDWTETYIGLCLQGLLMSDMPSANHVWGSYLRSHGFERYSTEKCEDCYTVGDFCREHPRGTLETAHMITDTIKNIEKIEALEADEYSEDDGMSYRGGYSGARHWVRGHYSRDARGGGMSYRGGNSYRGYSGRDDMMVKLGEMMPEASEEQREILERAMRALEKI